MMIYLQCSTLKYYPGMKVRKRWYILKHRTSSPSSNKFKSQYDIISPSLLCDFLDYMIDAFKMRWTSFLWKIHFLYSKLWLFSLLTNLLPVLNHSRWQPTSHWEWFSHRNFTDIQSNDAPNFRFMLKWQNLSLLFFFFFPGT